MEYKVLLVEDNLGDVRLFKETLVRENNEVIEFEHTERLSKALHLLSCHDYDVVILDLGLPDSQGIETFNKVYQHSPNVPIIVMSNLDDEEFAIQAVQRGAQDYLVKKNSHHLFRSIRYTVERHKLREMIEQNAAELHKLNMELEERVVERTKHFQITNEKLQDEILKRKQMEEDIRHQAYHDALTSLPNRFLFNDRFAIALTNARRNDHMVAILFLDLDKFKNINDVLGHTIGDELLTKVSIRLKGIMREMDTIARVGGDEFVILIPVLNTIDDVDVVATKIIEALNIPFIVSKHEIYITTSIGISIFPNHGEDSESLLRNADIAMYFAKDNGRANYQVFSSYMNINIKNRFDMTNRIRQALRNDEFLLHYQPKININTEEITGVEALIRWQHKELGLLTPKDFIPMAEETGDIIQIGEFVLRKACMQNKSWQDQGNQPISVAVNLSSQQLMKDDFMHSICKVLKETGLEPKYLELEITETVAMQNIKHVTRILNEIKEMGIKISMDDFGIGYSSFGYLKDLPIDCLKIDRSFISSIDKNKKDAIIVDSVIDLSHKLRLMVIAEGVETKKQLKLLKEYKCDGLQGFLFHKPLPPNELEVLLKRL